MSASIAQSGYFEMSRVQNSFYVTGTDFPILLIRALMLRSPGN